MDNQHRKITGYRDLNEDELYLINEGKALEKQCNEFIAKLEQEDATDKRSAALAKTNLQQGFMWAIRSIAKPE